MPEVNPTAVIADCIERSKTTTDEELVTDYITDLQIDNTEEDAFHCSAARSPTPLQMTKRTPLVCSMSGRSSKSSGSWRSAQLALPCHRVGKIAPAEFSREARSIV